MVSGVMMTLSFWLDVRYMALMPLLPVRLIVFIFGHPVMSNEAGPLVYGLFPVIAETFVPVIVRSFEE